MKRVFRPPAPPGCRTKRGTPSDKIEAISRYYHYRDELEVRRALYVSLDESLDKKCAKGGGQGAPSTRLYGGRLDTVISDWERRWWFARATELGYLNVSELLLRAGLGLSCRTGSRPVALLLAAQLGSMIHRKIQSAYRLSYPTSTVSTDNRVHFGASGSEKLSELARKTPASVYGALNFALAGQRCDIVDLDRREVWEIKPGPLASEAVLQLWAYCDNYETARVFERCYRGADLPALAPGDPAGLPRTVLEQFTLRLGPITLVVQPYVASRAPGLILYHLSVRQDGRPANAQAIAQAGRLQLLQLMQIAGRSEAERREAEIRMWENATTVAAVTLVTCVVLEVILASRGAAVPPAAGGPLAEVIPLALRRAAVEGSREAAREILSKAAGVTIITTAAGSFPDTPPEGTGFVIGSGMDVGVASSQAKSSGGR